MSGTPWSMELAGYEPARSEFAVEFDNFAEVDIRGIHFTESTDDEDECEVGKEPSEDAEDAKKLINGNIFIILYSQISIVQTLL